MVSNEVENVLLAATMDVLATAVVTACNLKAVLKPPVFDPSGNLLVIFTQANSARTPHRVAVPHSP